VGRHDLKRPTTPPIIGTIPSISTEDPLVPFANRRVGIQTKLMGLSSILLAFTALIAVLAIVSLQKMDDGADTMQQRGAAPLAALATVRALAQENTARLSRYINEKGVTTRKVDPEAQIEAIKANRAVSLAALERAGKNLPTDALRTQFAAMTKLVTDYTKQRDKVVAQARKVNFTSGSDTTAIAAWDASVAANTRLLDGAWADASKALADMSTSLERNTETLSASAESTHTSGRNLILVLLGLSLAIGLVLAYLVSRGVRRGVDDIVARGRSLADHCLTDLEAGLAKLADGDLTQRVTPVTSKIERISNDEIGDIARAVNDIRDRTVASVLSYNSSAEALGKTIGQVSESAVALSASSQQMASTSEEAGRAVGEIAHAVSDVAQGAERQARTAESTREVADQMSQSTTQGAEAVRETATAAEATRTAAQEGTAASLGATEAMQAMAGITGEVVVSMGDLSRKSDEIGGIVDTITGIAGQTNLLALNAAIEAARAGEQGRGFAVVAEQVRKLAEESQDAAASIASLVEEIQADAGRTSATIGRANEQIEVCTATSAESTEAFSRITGSVTDVHARIDQIAVVMDEIAHSADRVREDVAEVAAVAEQSSASSEQVSASTEETSASTQEVAASAQELARTAEELDRLCAGFVLTGTDAR
jgi:methyl-accepting chemotaxis protein